MTIVLRGGNLRSRTFQDVLKASIFFPCTYDLNVSTRFNPNVRKASQVAQVISPVRLTLSPAVRYLVGTHNITDTSTIRPTGPKSRLLKGDILRYLDGIRDKPKTLGTVTKGAGVAQYPAAAKHRAYTDVPVGKEQREAAVQMVRSKEATPHVYFTADCPIPAWLHEQSEEIIQAHVFKCAAQATLRIPEMVPIDCKVQSQSDLSISFSTADGVGPPRKRVLSTGTVAGMALGELSQALAGNPVEWKQNTNLSVIYHTQDFVLRGCTDILLPGEVMTVHVIGRHKNDNFINITADVRVISLELVAKWLESLKTMCLRTL